MLCYVNIKIKNVWFLVFFVYFNENVLYINNNVMLNKLEESSENQWMSVENFWHYFLKTAEKMDSLLDENGKKLMWFEIEEDWLTKSITIFDKRKGILPRDLKIIMFKKNSTTIGYNICERWELIAEGWSAEDTGNRFISPEQLKKKIDEKVKIMKTKWANDNIYKTFTNTPQNLSK